MPDVVGLGSGNRNSSSSAEPEAGVVADDGEDGDVGLVLDPNPAPAAAGTAAAPAPAAAVVLTNVTYGWKLPSRDDPLDVEAAVKGSDKDQVGGEKTKSETARGLRFLILHERALCGWLACVFSHCISRCLGQGGGGGGGGGWGLGRGTFHQALRRRLSLQVPYHAYAPLPHITRMHNVYHIY